MTPNDTLVAIADYRPEDYARIRALAPDGGGMEKTFGEWKKLADQHVVGMAMAGYKIMRVIIDPDEFSAWLATNKIESNPETRARFCHEKASRKISLN